MDTDSFIICIKPMDVNKDSYKEIVLLDFRKFNTENKTIGGKIVDIVGEFKIGNPEKILYIKFVCLIR